MSEGDPTGELERLTAPEAVVEDSETSPPNPAGALAAGAAFVQAAWDHAGHDDVREIWRLSWPVMLSQVLVTAVALVDIAMVGRLGAQAVAAVGYATQFFFMTQSALFAVGFACVALMARAIGAGRLDDARTALAASLFVGVATAVLMSAGVILFPRTILGWLNAEPHVIELCVPYLRLVLSASVLLAVGLVIENGLRADKDTVTPMCVAAIVAAVKITLNGFWIFGWAGAPRLELVGAGYATLVSQTLGFLVFCAVLMRKPRDGALGVRGRDLPGALRKLGAVIRVAAPGVIERLMLNLALLSYFAILGTYGTVAVAAYTVGVRALSFSWIPGTGFAAAVATLVGQALGRGSEADAVSAGKRAVAMSLVTAVVLGCVAGFGREWIARLFTSDAQTIATLGPFMLCLAIVQPLLQGHFTLAGVHRGAGDTWTPLVAAVVGNWGVRVPGALICAYVFETSLIWIWAVIVFDHAARTAWLYRTFSSGRWKRALGG
jgi:putative MATE family efflux protein